MKAWAQFFWEHPTLNSSLRTSGPYRSSLRWRLMWCLISTTSWATDRTVRRTTALRPGRWTTERSAYLLTYLRNHTATMDTPFNVKVHGPLLGPHSVPVHFSLEQRVLLSPALHTVTLSVWDSAPPGSSQVQSSSAKRHCLNSAFCSLKRNLAHLSKSKLCAPQPRC